MLRARANTHRRRGNIVPGQDASTRKIQAADLESKRKPASGIGDEVRTHVLLHMQSARTVPLPEPADGSWVNWRETEPWEFGLVVAARLRERRAELAMLRGLIG